MSGTLDSIGDLASQIGRQAQADYGPKSHATNHEALISELEKMVVLIAPQILSGEFERVRQIYQPKHEYPCGGIVPQPQFKLDVNTGDAVIKLDDAKKMLEQLTLF